MPAGQQFLFKPERPLVMRLGSDFFKSIPTTPGVYKMHDAKDVIVYVGKARNLRQRLRSYRVANPERMARRHLRLLQSVVRIEFDLCEDEAAALQHESKLIRQLKPKFNRAGVWQGKPKFLLWRFSDRSAEFLVRENPIDGWEYIGSLGAYAPRLMCVLVRLLWLSGGQNHRVCDMPFGWMQNVLPENPSVIVADLTGLRACFDQSFRGDDPTPLISWLAKHLEQPASPFETAAIANDLEELQEFFARLERQRGGSRRES